MPILSLDNTVVFPVLAIPISIQKPASVKAVEAALASENRMIAAFAEKDAATENPQPADLYELGTVATIQLISRVGTTLQIIIHGVERISIVNIIQTDPFLKAQVRPCPVTLTHNIETEALQREVLEHTERYFTLAHPGKQLHFPNLVTLEEDILQLVYPVTKLLQLDVAQEQELLAAATDREAMALFNGHLIMKSRFWKSAKRLPTRPRTS